MTGGKTIANIFAGILILFGVLFILGSGDTSGQASWLGTGGLLLIVGFAIILLTSRKKNNNKDHNQNITKLEINLPSDVDIERFVCQNCGSQLSMDNVKMIAGAPMVSCPYCDAAYQLTESPKW